MSEISLPRFDDPQEVAACSTCEHCGGEIYPGEDIYSIEKDDIHEDCIRDYLVMKFEDCREVAGDE